MPEAGDTEASRPEGSVLHWKARPRLAHDTPLNNRSLPPWSRGSKEGREEIEAGKLTEGALTLSCSSAISSQPDSKSAPRRNSASRLLGSWVGAASSASSAVKVTADNEGSVLQ